MVLGLAQLFCPQTSHRMRIVWPGCDQGARLGVGFGAGGRAALVVGRGGGVVAAATVTLRWIYGKDYLVV
jgi:hypothetical protein